jgi:hypothetical protein
MGKAHSGRTVRTSDNGRPALLVTNDSTQHGMEGNRQFEAVNPRGLCLRVRDCHTHGGTGAQSARAGV